MKLYKEARPKVSLRSWYLRFNTRITKNSATGKKNRQLKENRRGIGKVVYGLLILRGGRFMYCSHIVGLVFTEGTCFTVTHLHNDTPTPTSPYQLIQAHNPIYIV